MQSTDVADSPIPAQEVSPDKGSSYGAFDVMSITGCSYGAIGGWENATLQVLCTQPGQARNQKRLKTKF